MVSSRVLLYGESYALRFQTTTTASTLPFVGAAPPHSAPVTVNFSCNATDLPVLARCGEFLVHHGPSYCVLESSKMTLEQLRDVLASGELFHVAAGEAVWNALLAADDGAEDAGDVDDEDGYNDDNDSRTVADVTGLLLVAGVFVQGDGSVVSDLITQRQRSDAATNLRMLASRATAALAAVARVQAPLLAVGVAAQVLAFRESLVVALQVPPVVGAREVLLLWGVRWAPGQLRAAVDERAGAGIERAGGSSGASRVSSALAQVRVLQFSPTAVFDDADNDALLALCLDALPCLQALCLKGASGITVATIQRLLTEHKALRFVCVVGAKRPSIARELAAMKFGAALTDKIIAVSLGAVATSDARERAKRAAYDWLMASAARRFSTSLPQLAAAPAASSIASTVPPRPPQVVFRPFARPVVTLTDVEHRFSLDAGARRSFLDRVLAFIESGASDDFPLPINIGADASLHVTKDSKKKFVEYRTLLLDKAGSALIEMSLWCAAGFVLVMNWCSARDIQVTCRQCPVPQPLVDLFVRCYAEWTGNDWSTGRVEQHADKQV